MNERKEPNEEKDVRRAPAPRSNPSTGQIISPVEGNPYVPKGKTPKPAKDREAVTIAPSAGQGPDVRVTPQK